MNRRTVLSASLVVAAALAAAGPAYATTFDAAHEPPEITNPGVQASEGGFPESFTVTLSFTLTCPGLIEWQGPPPDSVPYTVAFSTPYGTTSLALANGCEGTWQENHALGLFGEAELNPQSGDLLEGYPDIGQPPVEALKPTLSYKPSQSGPFLWQVIGPTGVVVAQGPEYAKVKTPGPREIDERSNLDAFINECIDGNHELHSKENGNLYCVIEESATASYVSHHWPAPPQITASTAPKWIRAAVLEFLHTNPKHFSATECKQRSLGRFRCLVAWRVGSRTYSGSVEVGNLNSATGAFRYALRVIETNHGRRRSLLTTY